ncbi:hypothetical protein [Streptomyces sp. NPDC057702]|uniref:hypothetical protein n=1 Tax=unclassified Streptomyces TaxID=2593676 RepID=UPI0036A2D1EF
MDVTQQYALDLYRSSRQGVPAPPAPGRHDWRVVGELREYRRFQAVVAERAVGRGPVPRLLRAARGTLTRWLHPAASRGSTATARAAVTATTTGAEPAHSAARPRAEAPAPSPGPAARQPAPGALTTAIDANTTPATHPAGTSSRAFLCDAGACRETA